MRLRNIPAIVIVALAVCIAAARGQSVNDVTASILPSPAATGSQSTSHGYNEIRVALTNASPTKQHAVTLTIPADDSGRSGSSIRSITRTVKLAPNSSATVSLLQPPLPIMGEGLRFNVDGKSVRMPLYLSEHAMPSYSTGFRALFILTSSSLANVANQLTHATETQSVRLLTLRSELPIAQWSNQWLGYTRYDAVMLTADQMAHAPLDVGEALRRYVQAGGTLIVIGDGWSLPDSWGLHQPTPGLIPGQQYVGFGMVIQPPDESKLQANAEALARYLAENNLTWNGRPDMDAANTRLPVVEKLSIPVSGLLLLIITFAIVIGPVNLWVLGRKRRRMWLLWTVPTISLLTCGAIWGYSLMAEGWRGQVRTRTLTLLDQQHLTATTIGWAGYYAPLTPADGLRFAAETEVTPLLDRSYYGYYGSSSDTRSRSVDLTSQQHLDSGWIVARVPAYFMLRNTATPVRQRLVFAADSDGSINVTNGLGVAVKQLIYVDDAGAPFQLIDALPAGGKARLRPLHGEVRELNMLRVHELFLGNWMDSFNRLDLSFDGRDPLRSGIRPFGPGMYLAQTDQPNPFLQPGLTNLRKQQHDTYILGITSENSTPQP